MHFTCDFLASNKNHARVGNFTHKVTSIKNHAIPQGCTPFLYTKLPFLGNRVPIGVPGPMAISNGLSNSPKSHVYVMGSAHYLTAHLHTKQIPKMKSRPLQVPGFFGSYVMGCPDYHLLYHSTHKKRVTRIKCNMQIN